MKLRQDSADKGTGSGCMARLVRFFDSLGEHVGAGSIGLGLLAGLLAGGFIRFEIPVNKKLIESEVVVKSDTSGVGDSQKNGQLILPDKLTKIRFMEWVGATTSDDNISKPLEISIIVQECDSSTLHGGKTLGKRIIVRRIDSLRNVTVGDILNELPMNLPPIEQPTESGRDQKRDNADDNATSKVRSSIGEDHIHFLANVEAWQPATGSAPPLQVEVSDYPPTSTRGG